MTDFDKTTQKQAEEYYGREFIRWAENGRSSLQGARVEQLRDAFQIGRNSCRETIEVLERALEKVRESEMGYHLIDKPVAVIAEAALAEVKALGNSTGES